MRDEISVKIFKDNCQENNFKVKIVKSESELSTMLISWMAEYYPHNAGVC